MARGTATDQMHDYDSASISGAGVDRAGELALREAPQPKHLHVVPTIEPRISLRKRIFDVAGATAIGLATLPLMLFVAVAIRMTGSPVIFSHTRVGLGHRPFRCYKFRTMVPDAEERLKHLLSTDAKALMEWRTDHKLRNDPRVTRFGRFLRRSSLDELPQLWNVIKGEMSLVGPRPVVADELERYGNKVRDYCSVRPGMTGLWQVLGRNNVTYSRRVSLDVLYTRRQKLSVDCWVLWRTLFVVLRRIGAY